jgi:hypothetical protein
MGGIGNLGSGIGHLVTQAPNHQGNQNPSCEQLCMVSELDEFSASEVHILYTALEDGFVEGEKSGIGSRD